MRSVWSFFRCRSVAAVLTGFFTATCVSEVPIARTLSVAVMWDSQLPIHQTSFALVLDGRPLAGSTLTPDGSRAARVMIPKPMTTPLPLAVALVMGVDTVARVAAMLPLQADWDASISVYAGPYRTRPLGCYRGAGIAAIPNAGSADSLVVTYSESRPEDGPPPVC